MNSKEREERIIRNYEQDEATMVLIFAQWCVNHQLDPVQLYAQAYPLQASNPLLHDAIELTVPKDEAEEISDETLLHVLSLYDNDELAFVITEEINKCQTK